tara:strand:- start:8787 stop:8963 length:177 start_codon:yes stop_codon:yes gene_type:complete
MEKTMILYTEEQLLIAYSRHIREVSKLDFVQIPTLEEFRVIYEEEWTQRYREMNDGED